MFCSTVRMKNHVKMEMPIIPLSLLLLSLLLAMYQRFEEVGSTYLSMEDLKAFYINLLLYQLLSTLRHWNLNIYTVRVY